MKKHGILNAQLAGLIAGLGHKDTYLIGDAGMPIPKGIEIVDLVLAEGVPTFEQVLDAVLDEAQVEGYTLADEIQEANPRLHAYIQKKLPGVPVEYIPHDDLKQMTKSCKFAIRTGEFSPYPNIILRAGVVF
jgi:D-ribose pyranase